MLYSITVLPVKHIPKTERMKNMTEIKQIKMKEQPVMFIRHENLTVKDLPKIIGSSFQTLAAYIQQNGGEIKEAPFVEYYGMDKNHTLDENNITIEVGVPVSAPLEGTNDISYVLRPAMDAICVTHQGDYNAAMVQVYTDMAVWLKEHQATFCGISFESYLTGPDVPLDQQVTVITIPFVKEN